MRFFQKARWSPYLVGALLGMLTWFTFGVAQKALGVSTNFSQAVRLGEQWIDAEHARNNAYHQDYKIPTAVGWEAAILVGIVLGAWTSARFARQPAPELVPQVWKERFGPSVPKALLGAFLGGVILMFGARLAGGCTSGHGISGSLQLAVSSWVFFLSMFAGGLAVAFALYGKGGSHV